MTTERDPRSRIVLSWLREDAHENAERVLLRALDEVDTTSQRRSWWPARRFTPLSNQIRLTLAAAAAVILAVVGLQFLPAAPSTGTPTDRPVATSTPTSLATGVPTPAPTPSPVVVELRDGLLPAGRYGLTVAGSDVDVVLTVDGGWSGGGSGPFAASYFIISDARGSLSFWTAGNVGTDACDPFGTVPDPPIGPTVDEFVAALAAQRRSVTTPPETVTVGGHQAKRLEIRPSDNASCDELMWWVTELEPGRGAVPGQPYPDTLYVVDVDGQRIVIVAYIIGQEDAFDDVIASMELSRG